MKPRGLVVVCAAAASLAFSIPARAADREFKDIVSAICEEFQTKPMHIPLMGLVSGFVKVAHPAGAKQLDLAIFEDLDASKGSGRNLAESVRAAVGRWMQPMVQDRQTKNGQDETVLVYMFEKGKDANVLTVVIEADQAIVTELRLNPEAMQKWISSHDSKVKFWGDNVRRDGNDGSDRDK
jgi:hypothetical protein